MRLVLTVLARDEADVIDAQIAFHLNAGVDFVVATDNNSRDGTTEVLEEYDRAGCLRLIRALAVEIHEDWVEATRYLDMEVLKEQIKQQHRDLAPAA